MKAVIFLCAFIIIIGCNENNSVEPIDEQSEVQFDLQYGFENKAVSIIVDTTYYFNALLSPSAPLAGPLASFTYTLKKGEHTLIIFTSSLENVFETLSDTSKISIGESPKYFIGIEFYGDSIKVQVQDSSFFYI